jgi:hypothetical protein
MPRYRVTISGQGYDAMADLVRQHKVNVLPRTARDAGGDRYHVDAIVDGATIPTLEQLGYTVQRHEDVDEVGRQRQAEVGRGNRYL